MIKHCFILFITITNFSWALTGDEILAKVTAKFKSLESLEAKFEVSLIWQMTKREEKMEGLYVFKKPGLYSILMNSQEIWCNGETLWRYSKQNNQILIQDILDAGQTFDLGTLLKQSTKNYLIKYIGNTKINGIECWEVLLDSNSPDQYFSKLSLWIDPNNEIPKKVVTNDLNGNQGTYLFLKIKLNKEIADEYFDFTPPKGVETLDMR